MSKIIRAMSRDGSARILITDSTETVSRAAQIHNTNPTAAAALGRTLTAASLMGSLLGEETDLLTLRFKGDGQGGVIVASSDFMGNVRGFIQNPSCDLPLKSNGKLDVAGCVGKGELYVLRDTGKGEPYVGISNIVSGEIAEDIAYYFASSEQIPTLCVLGVLVDVDLSIKKAGGMLLQLLPFADESIIDVLEENIARLPHITTMMEEKGIEEILAEYLSGIEYDVFDQFDCGYKCVCSREKTDGALAALSKEELHEMYNSPEETILTCQFCDKIYKYSKSDIEKFFTAQ